MRNGLIPRIAALLALVAFLATLFLYAPAMERAPGIEPVGREQNISSHTEALLASPDNIQGWWSLATAFIDTGDANRALKRWLEEAPPELTQDVCAEGLVSNRIGSVFERRGDQSAAQTARTRSAVVLEEFARANPEHMDYFHWYTLALSYRWTDNCPGALRALRESEKKLDESHEALPHAEQVHQYSYLAQGYDSCEDTEGAIRALHRLIDIMQEGGEISRRDPEWFGDWVMLGRALRDLGDVDGARRAWKSKLDALSAAEGISRIDTWRDLGWEFRSIDADDLAARAWARYHDEREWLFKQRRGNQIPPSADEWFELACARALVGLDDEALNAWEEAVDAGYDDAVGADERPALHNIRNDPRFIEAYQKMLQPDPEQGRTPPPAQPWG